MTYKEKAQDIQDLMLQGKLLDAFDKYYHDDVVMTEPRGTFEGKVACREHEVEFLNYVKEFHGLDVKNIASDEENGVVFIESSMDVTFQDGNRVQMEQVSRQQWDGDHVKHEKFYYDNAGA